jgi:hypothetical protein
VPDKLKRDVEVAEELVPYLRGLLEKALDQLTLNSKVHSQSYTEIFEFLARAREHAYLADEMRLLGNTRGTRHFLANCDRALIDAWKRVAQIEGGLEIKKR